ncbi:MAG: NADH:flavin oxidoreductase/NADH oxidase family protein [Pseudomonadota bacterium]
MDRQSALFEPLTLPCGAKLKNRIVKAAMSDSLGDGTGHPTAEQIRLYQTWAEGGVAAALIGEVQGDDRFAEKPGNLVLNEAADLDRFRALAQKGQSDGALLWLQLGHAGALAYPPTSAPKGPSALDLPGLRCEALSSAEIERIPSEFARTARLAQGAGFGGVEVHAAHGFLLSQFLSPLFNRRQDQFGGSIENRMRLLLHAIAAIRETVGTGYPIAVKLNATDQLEGGLHAEDALKVVAALDQASVDLIDISGGTYFPGAKSASDGAGRGPYFLDFAEKARVVTTKPLMLTGGFKTRHQAEDAIGRGAVDCVGLARALVLEPALPNLWMQDRMPEPQFPTFVDSPEGGITAWYTMRLTRIAEGAHPQDGDDLHDAIRAYAERDDRRTHIWRRHFTPQG